MGTFSFWHWLILVGVVILLFGKGRLSDVMGDAAKGIQAFKRGMAEDDGQLRASSHRDAGPAPEEERAGSGHPPPAAA